MKIVFGIMVWMVVRILVEWQQGEMNNFKLFLGFDDGRTDIGGCRVAFATENCVSLQTKTEGVSSFILVDFICLWPGNVSTECGYKKLKLRVQHNYAQRHMRTIILIVQVYTILIKCLGVAVWNI